MRQCNAYPTHSAEVMFGWAGREPAYDQNRYSQQANQQGK